MVCTDQMKLIEPEGAIRTGQIPDTTTTILCGESHESHGLVVFIIQIQQAYILEAKVS